MRNVLVNQDSEYLSANGIVPKVGYPFTYRSKYNDIGYTTGTIKKVHGSTITSNNNVNYYLYTIEIDIETRRDEKISDILN